MLLIAIACVAAVLLAAVILWLMAARIEAQARTRDAVADVDTGGVSPAEWQRVRQLKRMALACLVVSVFAAACIWALFGAAIMDSLAAA